MELDEHRAERDPMSRMSDLHLSITEASEAIGITAEQGIEFLDRIGLFNGERWGMFVAATREEIEAERAKKSSWTRTFR